METRKNPKYDLEKKRSMFFTIGLCISLGFTITAFEWVSEEKKINPFMETGDPFEDIIEIPQTIIPPPPPPPKKIVVQPIIVPTQEEVEDDLKIVLDDEEIEDITVDIPYVPEPPEPPVDVVFIVSEVPPSPAGGMEAFYKHLRKHLKYPVKARRQKVQGEVFVQFVVGKNGVLRDIKVLRGVGYGCDEAATAVIKSFPKWNPGRQRGKPVSVRMVMPISFVLR